MRISDWSSDVCSSEVNPTRITMARRPMNPPLSASTCRLTMPARVRRNFDGSRGQRTSRLGADFTISYVSLFCVAQRSEEHTSELQSLMRISYAVFCLKKKQPHDTISDTT